MKSHRKNHIPAFTILELIIAMLISAIVIATAYTVMQLVVRGNGRYSAEHEQMASLLRLDEIIRKDVIRAELMQHSGNEVQLNAEGNIITYSFTPGQVIRTAAKIDTFQVEVTDLRFSYRDTLIESGITAATSDELSFKVRLRNELFPYHYFKHYSSAELLRNTENAIDRSPSF